MISSHGIVLHTTRYTDTQVIVSVYTEHVGMVSYLIKYKRTRTQGRLHASAWQPLSAVEVTWHHQERRSLQKPSEFGMWEPRKTIPFHPYKAVMALFLGEFLHHALRGESENKPLFDFLHHSLNWLDTSEEHFSNFHVVFLLRLTRFLGFYPNVDDWHEGYFFDMLNATFTPTRPLHSHYIAPEEAVLVPKFMRLDMRKMRVVGLNGAIRRRALQLIIDFYRLHVPEFPDIKSLEVLAEVFA